MEKPRPASKVGRKRRAAGWTLLALGMVVAGVWVASRWGWRGIYRPTWCVAVGRGTFTIEWGDLEGLKGSSEWWAGGWSSPEVTPAWDMWLKPEDDDWTLNTFHAVNLRIASYTDYGWLGFWAVELVLWPVPLMLWTSAVLLFRSGILARRRANTGVCPRATIRLPGLRRGARALSAGGRAKPSKQR